MRVWACVVLAGGFALGVPARGDEPPALRSAVEWERLARDAVTAEHERVYLPRSRSGNSWLYYNLAYAIDGNTAMFEATGDRLYLDRALELTENAIASARPSRSLPASQYRDDFLGWPASDHPSDRSIRGGEYPLYESYCWRYVARLLRVVQSTPTLADDEALRRRTDAILAFTERHVFDKWNTRGDGHIFRSRTHMAAHWAFLARELAILTADETRRARCRAIYERFDTRFRDQLRPHPRDASAVFWSDVWGKHEPPGQDVSHGNNVVAYLVEAHDLAPDAWTDRDLDALARLLATIVWTEDEGRPRYAAFVDGSGRGNGWFNDGFLKLGRHDAAIQKRVESHRVGLGIGFYGPAALNARRLADRAAKSAIGG
jgi:hypothetical protein